MSCQGIEYFLSTGMGKTEESKQSDKDSGPVTRSRSKARQGQIKRKRSSHGDKPPAKKKKEDVNQGSSFSESDAGSGDNSSSDEEYDYDYVPPTESEESEEEGSDDGDDGDDGDEESGDNEMETEDLKKVEPRVKRRKIVHREQDEVEGEDEEGSEEEGDEMEDGEIDIEEDEKLQDFISQLAAKLGQEVYENAMARADQHDAEMDTAEAMGMMGQGSQPQLLIVGGQMPGIGGQRDSIVIEMKKSGIDEKNNKEDEDEDNCCKKGGNRESRWDKKGKDYNLRKRPTDFRESLTPEQKEKLEAVEKQIWEMNRHQVPPRYKILLSNLTIGSKQKILANMDRLAYMNSYSSEYSKLTQWLDGVLSIPFDTKMELPISLSSTSEDISKYLQSVQGTMNECIYGQDQAKQSILECVGKWITNPGSSNRPLAFVGEKGTGKTTLAKYGIAKALGRPFFLISLGGESDAASFKGHDYTYEGARWGRIADAIIQAKCMNPVILFDELDKVSETRQGEEIIGMLMHLTDTTQNDKFTDKYFAGIDIDLSNCLFLFSYNHEHRVNPILRDRLTPIEFKSFSKKEKLIIAKNFLIPHACEKIGIRPDKFQISDSTIEELINRFAPHEGGVRDLEKIIERLFLRINLVQLPQSLDLQYKNANPEFRDGKFVITSKIADKILTGVKDNRLPAHVQAMYT